MHSLVLQRLDCARNVLTRISSKRQIEVVACHDASLQTLQWVAKTSFTSAGIAALRAEQRALEALGHGRLTSVPKLLAWDGNDAFPCLIQSGQPGRPLHFVLHTSAPSPPPSLVRAIQWLGNWQNSFSFPTHTSTQTVLGQYAERLRATNDSLSLALANRCEAISKRVLGTAVPVHGDYWSGNILFASDQTVSVVDWGDLTVGCPAEDLLFLLLNCTWVRNGVTIALPEVCDTLLFAKSAISALLAETIRSRGLSPIDVDAGLAVLCSKGVLGHWPRQQATWRSYFESLSQRQFPVPLSPYY